MSEVTMAGEPTSDQAGDPPDAWQGRFELIGALALGAAVSRLILAGCASWAQQRQQQDPGYAGYPGSVGFAPFDWMEVVRSVAHATDLVVAGMVVAAYALVVLGPGSRIGRLGGRVLQATFGLGLVAAALAAYAAFDWVHPARDAATDLYSNGSRGPVRNVLARVGQASPAVMAMALLGFVAWCALSTLTEVPTVARDDSLGVDDPSAVSSPNDDAWAEPRGGAMPGGADDAEVSDPSGTGPAPHDEADPQH